MKIWESLRVHYWLLKRKLNQINIKEDFRMFSSYSSHCSGKVGCRLAISEPDHKTTSPEAIENLLLLVLYMLPRFNKF